MDAHAALKYLFNRNDIDHSKIFLFGRSLGGAVAIGLSHLLLTSPKMEVGYMPAALIIENTFTSIPDISRHLFPGRNRTLLSRLFHLIPNWFYKNRYESLKKISHVKVPICFISGLADELIPPEMMAKLFNVKYHHIVFTSSLFSSLCWLLFFRLQRQFESCTNSSLAITISLGNVVIITKRLVNLFL